jgi:hypothetical protein
MEKRYKNNCVRTFFFVAILFFSLTLFENDICRSVSYSYASDLIKVEALLQPELPKEFQPYNGLSSVSQKKSHGSFYLGNIFECGKKFILSANNISNIYINNQNNKFLHFHRIILILQKNNSWHQSSDDEAFLHIFC